MVNIENITDTHLRGGKEQALNSTHTQAPLTPVYNLPFMLPLPHLDCTVSLVIFLSHTH